MASSHVARNIISAGAKANAKADIRDDGFYYIPLKKLRMVIIAPRYPSHSVENVFMRILYNSEQTHLIPIST